MGGNNRNSLSLFVYLVIVACFEVFFFRQIVFTDTAIGYTDAQLNNLIMEHWFRFFSGKEAVLNLNMFYPVDNVLSYSDLLFMQSLPYCFLRLFGVNLFTAAKITIVGIHFFGTLTVFYILKEKMNLNGAVSLIGTVLAAYSTNYAMRLGHTQMVGLSFVPFLLLLVILFVENFRQDRQKKRIFYGICSILWLELILCSSYYSGWFSIFFGGLYALIALIMGLICCKQYVIDCFLAVKNHIGELCIYVFAAAVGIIPFLSVYLPALGEIGPRPWKEVLDMLPRFGDFFNISTRSIFYGPFSTYLSEGLDVEVIKLQEITAGYPLLSFVCFVACSVYLTVFLRSLSKQNKEQEQEQENQQNKDIQNANVLPYLLFAAVLAIFVTYALIVKVGDFSLWQFVYKFVPGSIAIRVPTRLNVFLALPMGLVLAWSMQALYNKLNWKTTAKIACFGIFAVILMADNAVYDGVNGVWRKSSQMAFLERIGNPPAACQAIYMYDPDNSAVAKAMEKQQFAVFSLSCTLAATWLDKHAINGYAANKAPKNWPWMRTDNIEYLGGICEWVDRKYLDPDKIYAYDLSHNKWICHRDLMNNPRVYPFDNLRYCNGANVENHEGYRLIKNEGFVYGPHIFLKKGSYTVTIKGKNLAECVVASYFINGELPNSPIDTSMHKSSQFGDVVGLETNLIHKSHDEITFKFSIPNDTDKVGFRLRNKSKENVYFYGCSFKVD